MTFQILTKAGRPRDGDGDGRCLEGETPDGVPCVPGLGERVVDALWGRTQAKRLEKRRGALKRAKLRRSTQKDPKVSVKDIMSAGREGRLSEIENEIRDIFEMDNLGRLRARTEVQRIYSVGPDMKPGPSGELEFEFMGDEWSHNEVGVEGVLISYDGDEIGTFHRWFSDDGDRVVVKHEELQLDGVWTGYGIGGDFVADTQSKYPLMGVDDVKVDAGLSDGPYTWAVAGFDWDGEDQRKKFLGHIKKAITAYKTGSRPELFSDAQEAAAVQALLDRAMSEDFEDPGRLTPYAFTLFSGARPALTRQKPGLAHNRAWSGVRRLTPPS
jgi:hypothetical protein